MLWSQVGWQGLLRGLKVERAVLKRHSFRPRFFHYQALSIPFCHSGAISRANNSQIVASRRIGRNRIACS
jgi:hypothetical protein